MATATLALRKTARRFIKSTLAALTPQPYTVSCVNLDDYFVAVHHARTKKEAMEWVDCYPLGFGFIKVTRFKSLVYYRDDSYVLG